MILITFDFRYSVTYKDKVYQVEPSNGPDDKYVVLWPNYNLQWADVNGDDTEQNYICEQQTKWTEIIWVITMINNFPD